MKATHTSLPTSPEIIYSDNSIHIDNKIYTDSILFSPTWEMEIIAIKTPKQWLSHPKRRDCTQLLTWHHASPSPSILDLYWQQNIQADIMPISSAIQTAKILIGDSVNYQLVLFQRP